jgi:hypothetical protein
MCVAVNHLKSEERGSDQLTVSTAAMGNRYSLEGEYHSEDANSVI